MNATVTPLRVTDPDDTAGNALRVPPHSYDAERALLGAIMMNNRAYEAVSGFLRIEHFADPVNGRIYKIAGEVIDSGRLANPVTLKPYLEHDDFIVSAGGMKYLGTIAASAVTIINAREYGQMIYDLFLRRELIVIGEDMVNQAYDARPNEPAVANIEASEERLFQLASEGTGEGGLVDFADAATSALRIAEAAHQRRGALAGVTTGLRDLDKKLAGLHPTDLIILAGRPSMGKTALATHIAEAAALSCAPDEYVAFFSLEMSKEQLATRMAAKRANIDSHRIRAGELSDAEFEQLAVATQAILSLPLKIDDTPAATVASIRSRSRRLMRRKKLKAIVIDYLQLISPGGREKPENRVQEVSAMTRGLKAVAKELNVPVLALSQLSRAVEQREDKRPQLSDLRESGTIEQDADVVMFVYREEYYLERTEPADHQVAKWNEWKSKLDACVNVAEIILAKQRHGPIGTVRTHFEPTRTQFSDLEQRRAAPGPTFVDRSHPDQDQNFSAEPPPGHPAAQRGFFDGL